MFELNGMQGKKEDSQSSPNILQSRQSPQDTPDPQIPTSPAPPSELFYSGHQSKSQCIIYTPSSFARTSLLFLQETGTLQVLKPHASSRANLQSYLFFIVRSGSGWLEHIKGVRHHYKILRKMDSIRSSETVVSNGGTGYRFNAEGNQVTYRCDVKQVTTINFDRNVVRKYIRELDRKVDAVSAQIDQCLVNSTVEYEAPFDVNDSLYTIFEEFAPEK